MGKASSSKKVARAAGTGGGRTNRGRVPWGYYSVIALVIILGVVGTVTSRERRIAQINDAGKTTAPAVGTLWHEGYAVDECGKFVSPIVHAADPHGITTGTPSGQKADPSTYGVIKIDPTSDSVAGKNATLGVFASAVGMKLNAAELQTPGGKLYLDGDKCGGKTSHVYVKQFAFIGDTTGALQNVDPRNIRLQNQVLLTIAFVPASEKNSIPPPPSYVNTNLAKFAASSSTTTTTTPAATGTTTPTTAPKSTPTTAAKTTPTTAAKTTATTKAP